MWLIVLYFLSFFPIHFILLYESFWQFFANFFCCNKCSFSKVLNQNFTNLIKKGYVFKNYQQRLKLKMFKLENDITLLLVGCISLIRGKVRVIVQCIMFPLLALRVICDDKSKSRHGHCPSSLASIQNTNCHEILQVLMVWIHNDFMLNSFKQMIPLLKGIHNG